MTISEDNRLQRGMSLVSQLPEVMPDQADARIGRLYDEIRNTLRVPFVNFIFRVLANDPDYLGQAWSYVGPIARSVAFERAADRLRAAALIEPVPDGPSLLAPDRDALDRIRGFTNSIHYVLPKLLLILHLLEPSERRAGDRRDLPDGADAGPLPYGIAAGTEKIGMVDPSTADAPLRALFDDIKERHRHPGVATYYRSLGHWPDVLAALWERLRPLVGSRAYEDRKADVSALASALARDLAPGGGAARPQPSPDQEAILTVFRDRIAADLTLDVALVKAILDGAEAARVSRFSAACLVA